MASQVATCGVIGHTEITRAVNRENFFRPCRDLSDFGFPSPTDESVGYCRVSLPGQRRPAINVAEVRADNCGTQRGQPFFVAEFARIQLFWLRRRCEKHDHPSEFLRIQLQEDG
jgi:hypothetical protein